ncbi:MAG: hypothetical protein M3R63_15890 [Actinomycetota bacterium]|nr:hypothetical protein [Actinomycetota bacterium]
MRSQPESPQQRLTGIVRRALADYRRSPSSRITDMTCPSPPKFALRLSSSA